MKQLIRIGVVVSSFGALAMTAFAGSETYSGKEMKQVAPAPPPECDWTGFYIGINVGGQFGHSEDKDLDGFNAVGKQWGYSESGVVGGGQVGYNYQWHCLVLGVEVDGGYMNLDGNGFEPAGVGDIPDTHGKSESDFYATFRGRLGYACGHWLFYGTGGGIGVNYETLVQDPDLTDAHKTEFDWGWTGGGGIEYMLGCHWSIKTEYLYYKLDDQTMTNVDVRGVPFGWRAETEGHIVRAGLNYKF